MASKVEWLIAGLGNPGDKYKHSRHNIGWMVGTALAEKYKKPVMQFSPKYMHSAQRINGQLVLMIMPTTFMNLSGEAVSEVCKDFGIAPERVVAICDEYNFPVGKVHLRRGGGDGGHNGIASIIEELDSNEFFRLRCGIGKGFESGEMVDYVLSSFRDDEISDKDIMVSRAVESIETLVRLGEGQAMSVVNSGKLWKPDADDSKNEKENEKNDTELKSDK